MANPLLQSLHLEGLPRRAEFRAARNHVEACCGQHTIAGELGLLIDNDPGDGPTVQFHETALPRYSIRDGEKRHQLLLGINSIGRLVDNTIVIPDECISRRHCAIVVHRTGLCELHDVASKNGTILNGRKIGGPTRIVPGDTITLCGRSIEFLVALEPEPPA